MWACRPSGLIGGSHPDASALGLILATGSLLVLPWLGRMKLQVASRLPSPALRGDGILSIAAAALAAITLVTLLVNSALGWWWADAVAALVIATALVAEASRGGSASPLRLGLPRRLTVDRDD